ncbi:hypothetical protein OSB04_015107 [Centaurea solstitialis]|uniref:Uncharacterized protein n=1 Tax=Centaurea solstitialis TaxID=347529 RepID=A0AA38W744_9ASTR|nr:hypothetical protein OSB04_015107 [Centaurea solstitialis]
MVDDKPILEQVHELQVLVNKMNSLSISIPEIFQVGAIIDKLPPSWKDFSKRMMHKSEDYSLDDILKHLRIEEEARNRDKKSKNPMNVNSVQAGGKCKGKFKSGGPSKKWNLGPQKKAFKRQGQTSIKRDFKRNGKCHVCGETGHYARECKQRKSGPPTTVNAVGEIGELVANLTMDEINTLNVTPQIHVVSQKKISWYLDTGTTAHVSTANGAKADIAGCGDILLHFTSYRTIRLQSVLHVPTISKNLLSYSKLDTHGFGLRGSDGTIVFLKNEHYIGKAYLVDGMYHLSLRDDPEDNVGGPDEGYMVTVDEELGSGSNQAFEAFKIYKAEVENQKEKRIKILRSDRGGEYFNHEFDTFCEENGIKHERTSPFTPQQNGLAERKNRTLVEMVNCMLNQSGLPTNLWGEALLTACYIHNRITSRVIPTSPYELWKGRKPDLDYFRVWGCVAYYRTPDPKRSKLGDRAIKSIFVGYAVNSPAYRLLDKETGVIVESRGVDFLEDKFSGDAENSDRILDSNLPGTSNNGSKTSQKVDEPRRSTRVRKEKSLGDDFLSYLVEGNHKKVTREIIFSINIDDDPKTFEEAMSSRDASLWREAINDEMDSIMSNGTWVLADLPKGSKPIGSKWIFKRKRYPDGTISAFKARLVAKGYRQREGIDYFDTYAPVARISSIRTLIAISALKVGILETKKYLSSNFKMKDLGEVDTILGIKVKRSESQFSLSQSHYIEKILTKFQHLNIKEFNTPFDSSMKLDKNSGRAVAQLEYASAIGCMMYAMHCTRPDIAFGVSRLSQFTSNPGTDHWKAVGRVLGYLKRTSDLELTYNTHPGILEGYTDASWIDNSDDSKSTSGWIYTLAGGAISWASKKQTCIAHSTMEAEFIALAVAGKEAEWIRDLLTDLHFWSHPTPSIPMYCDSEATLSKVYNSMYNGKSRHMGLRHNYVRQLIENGTISIVYVKSCGNLADPLTKPLTRDLIGSTTRDKGLKPRRISQ